MGKNVDRIRYNKSDFQRFEQATYQQLDQLKEIIKQSEFGQEPLMLGAELEMYLVDEQGNVSNHNQLLIEQLQDPQFTVELNQYNLELNLSAVPQKGRPFSALVDEMRSKTAHLEKLAASHQVNVLPIGILPTLKREHLNVDYMTDLPRYHCLSDQIYRRRGEAFKININGEEPLSVSFDDICAEGANTSFQVHCMVKPENFAATFNAAQLSLPLVTAIAGNSGIFLGQKLWDETRIALFKQSLDIRAREQSKWQRPTRVNFGFGWVRQNPWELFAEAVALYEPILPCTTKGNKPNGLPALDELNLHMGTIWPWHRPVYCHQGNGHIRIEFRALPAGPTCDDMAANAAFAIGLATGFAEQIDDLLAVVPFRFAEYNFYRAAQHGLDASILWPFKCPYRPQETAITEVLQASLPIARKGLLSLDIEEQEVDYYLNIIEQRLNAGVTGAIWQKQTLTCLEQTLDKQTACQQLVNLYLEHARSCQPVAQWPRCWS
jgi:gamma-glutamyl:cysteine ligase YbdK (ATP-grasp superfamily)